VEQKILRGRPDDLDRDILACVQRAPNGATVTDIRLAVCPSQRELFVRYRAQTLAKAGLAREVRVLGRILFFPADIDRTDRRVAVDG